MIKLSKFIIFKLSKKKLKIISLLFLLSFFALNNCGIYKPTDARKIPGNAKERAKKNLEEGKGIKFGNITNRGSGQFEFASSNEMWRATIDLLDFIPLISADYGGGIIISDWHSDSNYEGEYIKIIVKFLSNEIRADGLKVTVYRKICKEINTSSNCSTNINENISNEIKVAILKKASILKNEKTNENIEKYKKSKPITNPIFK